MKGFEKGDSVVLFRNDKVDSFVAHEQKKKKADKCRLYEKPP